MIFDPCIVYSVLDYSLPSDVLSVPYLIFAFFGSAFASHVVLVCLFPIKESHLRMSLVRFLTPMCNETLHSEQCAHYTDVQKQTNNQRQYEIKSITYAAKMTVVVQIKKKECPDMKLSLLK